MFQNSHDAPDGEDWIKLITMCDGCFHTDTTTGNLTYVESTDFLAKSVKKFRLIDYMVSMFSLGVVAFTMVRELKDVKVNELQIEEFMRKTKGIPEEDAKNRWWKFGLQILMWARQHVLIPMLVGAQADMIVYRGDDAIGILTNTVSLVIILDMDEMAYWNALPIRVHNYFEVNGIIKLDSAKQKSMERANLIYLILIPVSVLIILIGYSAGVRMIYIITIVAFPFVGQLCEVFFLSGLLEGRYDKDTVGRIDLVMMSCFFGCIAVLSTMAALELLYNDVIYADPKNVMTVSEKMLWFFNYDE